MNSKAGAAAGGRHARRKGADAERELVCFLREHGFLDATHTWQAAQSLLAAERRTDVTFAGLRAQCKRRARLDTLYGWLEGVDVCFLRADGKPWLALLPAERLPLIESGRFADVCGMEKGELEGLLRALEEQTPLTPAQYRIIRETIERLFQAEGWELPGKRETKPPLWEDQA